MCALLVVLKGCRRTPAAPISPHLSKQEFQWPERGGARALGASCKKLLLMYTKKAAKLATCYGKNYRVILS